jgi:predicted amidohydrolase
VGAFDTEAMLAHGEAVPQGPTVQRIRALARQHEVWIHAGAYAERADDGRRANTSVVIAPDGTVTAIYRKIHLFGFDEGEAALLESGTQQVVTPTPLGATGLTTCYDLRFPELFRALTRDGAEAFIVPAGWPARRIEHWRVLLRARAIENQAWVVGANGVGEHAGVLLGGRSVVIDPWGEVIVEAPADRECLVVAQVSSDAAAATRAAFPVLKDRRLSP